MDCIHDVAHVALTSKFNREYMVLFKSKIAEKLIHVLAYFILKY